MQQNVDESLILNSVLKVPTERVFLPYCTTISCTTNYIVFGVSRKPLDILIRSRMSVLKIVI